MTLGKAQYRLNSLKWNKHFFIGIGDKKIMLKGESYLKMLRFTNGDRFFHNSNFRRAFIIYGGKSEVLRCIFLSNEAVEAVNLPVSRHR